MSRRKFLHRSAKSCQSIESSLRGRGRINKLALGQIFNKYVKKAPKKRETPSWVSTRINMATLDAFGEMNDWSSLFILERFCPEMSGKELTGARMKVWKFPASQWKRTRREGRILYRLSQFGGDAPSQYCGGRTSSDTFAITQLAKNTGCPSTNSRSGPSLDFPRALARFGAISLANFATKGVEFAGAFSFLCGHFCCFFTLEWVWCIFARLYVYKIRHSYIFHSVFFKKIKSVRLLSI